MTVLASLSTSLFDQPGTLGFLVIFAMAIALYFVFRSMSRHLRKVRDAATEPDQPGQGHDSDGGSAHLTR